MTDQILHFDSIYSQYTLPSNDPFNARFALASPIVGASKIYFKSLELPINFCNVRSGSTLNKITLISNLGTQGTATIPQANYITMASLITAINTAIYGLFDINTTISFAVSSNRIVATLVSSTTISSFNFVDTLLSKYILGFRNSTSGSAVTSTTDYLLSVDNYIIMFLANVSASNTSNNGNLLCSFKIALNAVNGIVYYVAENNQMTQSVNLLNSSQCISYLQVVIYDRFGNQILSNNSDYSFSLGIEY